MTEKEVLQMVRETEFPAAYHHFEEGTPLEIPFIVFLFPQTSNFSADGIVYQGINQLDIELYTDKKDLKAEKKVETVLEKYGFFYEKTETYLESERMYEVLYEMEVLINE